MWSTFPRSGVLVLGENSVQSLVPSTVISQVESLLDSHRIPEAVNLVNAQRKKLPANVTVDSDEADELRYAYQRIGFQCFLETRFVEAFDHFFNGELDPRLVISYYPELRGFLFSSDDSMDVFAGVAERMPTEASVEDIIRNYSPHLSPNTKSAPSTVELRKVLLADANEELEVFVSRWKARRKGGNGAKAGSSSPSATRRAVVDPSLMVVDTVLVKLYAQSQRTNELYLLLQGQNQVVLSEVETVLRRTGQYSALCMLYRERGEDVKLLEVWSKLIDGEWIDDDVKDPISSMISLLTDKRDRALTQHWGVWLVKRDPERGLKLLMQEMASKRRERPEEDLALLNLIREANQAAGIQFLEYLVLRRRSSSRHLHTQLASSYIDQLCTALTDDTTSKLWRAKASSYASSPKTNASTSFLSYFSATTPDSPSKRVRLKTILFLAGSSSYDAAVIRPRLAGHEKVLKLEIAILDGKMGDHRAVLTTLVHSLHDTSSAETYCILGGESVIPVKAVQSVVERDANLEGWFFSGVGGDSGRKAGEAGVGKRGGVGKMKQKASTSAAGGGASVGGVVDEGVKRELLKILLEVYMIDAEGSENRSAQMMINSQGMNLDVLDVISLVPSDWPLNFVSSFLARSFRRTLHAQHEGKIVKGISMGQNLEVKDTSWLRLREGGMDIEEPVEDDDDDEDEDSDIADERYNEKEVLADEIARHLASERKLTAAAATDDDVDFRTEKVGVGGEGFAL